MINTEAFVKTLTGRVEFFAGVPDSLLKDLINGIKNAVGSGSFHTSPNEGAAVALCAGYYLATGKTGVAYMQNSGIGNAVNPLLSLCDPMVYGIPMLLFIGWRGEPGVPDEPQHAKQGIVTCSSLEGCGIPFMILTDDGAEAEKTLAWALETAKSRSCPVALIIKKGVFDPVKGEYTDNGYGFSREKAIEALVRAMPGDALVVSTTGMISRELYEIRKRRGEENRDFLTVGSMGHASQIALAIALNRPGRKVFCLDGDGAVLMHMGSLASIGASGVSNYYHVVFDNEAHDSVGGQPTIMGNVDICAVASACGYTGVYLTRTEAELDGVTSEIMYKGGRFFVDVKVKKGARKELGRPGVTPVETKEAFMSSVLGKRNLYG